MVFQRSLPALRADMLAFAFQKLEDKQKIGGVLQRGPVRFFLA